MADKSCVKHESKIPTRYDEETPPNLASKKRKSSKKENNLDDVILTGVDKAKKRVKNDGEDGVDGEGFPFVRCEKLNMPSGVSLVDRKEIFHEQLYREIKKKLYSGVRDDPDVRIELSVDPDVFEGGLATAVKGMTEENETVYRLSSNRLIDKFLGKKWDERIFNVNGDFAFVIEGTASYWLSKSDPIEEYKLIGDQYVKAEIEDRHFIVFTFVRGDGNRYNYNSYNDTHNT